MVRVRVHKIESIRDPEGNLGKRIELVEERRIPRFSIKPATEEARVVHEVMQMVRQQLPIFSTQAHLTLPKVILFLTEDEYDRLGITFDVNQVYEMNLSNQTIRFKRVE